MKKVKDIQWFVTGWSIYFAILLMLNVIYFRREDYSQPLVILWAFLFTLIGSFTSLSLRIPIKIMLENRLNSSKALIFILITSFLGAFIWGLFEPLISFLINRKITHLVINLDINTRGTIPLTFIQAFFGSIFFFRNDQSNISQKTDCTTSYKEPIITNNKITVYRKNEIVLLDVMDIKKVSVAGNYSTVVDIMNNQFELKKSLINWSKLLPNEIFIRIHRNTIINKHQIDKIESIENYCYKIRLKGTRSFDVVSRRYSSIIRKEMSL